MKKMLGIIGSPRKNGNTHILVSRLLEGAALEGVRTEELFLADLKIQECTGCHACWKPGLCRQGDDMNRIYPRVIENDILVFGTPVYWYGPTAIMKIFFDRFVFFNCRENREKIKGKTAVIVVPFEERSPDTARPLIDFFERSFRYLEIRFEEKLIVPGVTRRGEVLKYPEIIQKAYETGRSLAGAGGF